MDYALQTPPASQETATAPLSQGEQAGGFRWTWLVLVGLLLGLSGGVRFWRDHQFQSWSRESEKPPFSLSEFPRVLGDWRVVEGSEITLDPEVARIAGSTDSLVLTYTNDLTGENAAVMILYGLAFQVFAHTPDVCYPSAGFRSIPSSIETVEIRIADPQIVARFRKQRFAKVTAGNANIQEVYHSFRNGGQWIPDMSQRWKAFRYSPGMFKIQVQRSAPAAGDDDSSAVQLLRRIVEEIEQRLRAQS